MAGTQRIERRWLCLVPRPGRGRPRRVKGTIYATGGELVVKIAKIKPSPRKTAAGYDRGGRLLANGYANCHPGAILPDRDHVVVFSPRVRQRRTPPRDHRPRVLTSIRSDTVPILPRRRQPAPRRDEWLVVRDVDSGAEVIRGRFSQVQLESAGSKPLFVADFSSLRREGKYRLEVVGRGVACEFDVAKDICNWPCYCAIRAMYLWRCGTAVTAEFGGKQFKHAACHLDDAYLDYVGRGRQSACQWRGRLARRR